jgi:hypothetical protein
VFLHGQESSEECRTDGVMAVVTRINATLRNAAGLGSGAMPG